MQLFMKKEETHVETHSTVDDDSEPFYAHDPADGAGNADFLRCIQTGTAFHFGITYIDVEFANYTTHDIVFRESNLNVYILDFDRFLEDDESLMEENTEIVNIYDSSNNFSAYYYPDEVRVKPGEDITITFETDEYRVDYDPEYSRVISDIDYCGRSYAVIFSNWDDPAPIRDSRRPELAAKHQGISRAQKKQ